MGITYNPRIVTDGLVLVLDAGNSKSYPGSGTTWTDISGRGNTGTLTNGPTYSSANGGSIVFDGTNDYVDISSTSAFNWGLGDWTIELWFFVPSSYSTSNTYGSIFQTNQMDIGILRSGLTGTAGFYNYDSGFGFISSPFGGYTFGAYEYSCAGKWTQLSITKNGGTNYCYLNGTLYASKATNALTNQSNSGKLGIYNDGSSYPLNGNIPKVSIYNRALTATEVSQNFNALRSRFSI
jgi:hypothetical protein